MLTVNLCFYEVLKASKNNKKISLKGRLIRSWNINVELYNLIRMNSFQGIRSSDCERILSSECMITGRMLWRRLQISLLGHLSMNVSDVMWVYSYLFIGTIKSSAVRTDWMREWVMIKLFQTASWEGQMNWLILTKIFNPNRI